ncbi:MAG: hypothetical protein FWD47_03170, partial [Treponema sp.]|nr:hypothetical protein [Treponema sp.]
MKKNNKLFFVLLTAALILSLVSCPDGFVGDGDMVTISINLGSRSVLTAWPPSPEIQKELEYVITFTNTSGEKVTARSKGSSTIKVKIQPGIWDIDIDAIYKGTLYATGSVSDYEIIAGQVNTVTTTME